MSDLSAKRIASGVVTVAALVILFWTGMTFAGRAFLRPETLGGRENVVVHSPSGEIEIVATIDTGADLSSIDQRLAISLGFSPVPGENRRIVTDQGTVDRDIVRIEFRLGNRDISSIATLADRSGLGTQMLVGKSDLTGFAIDASRGFLGTLRAQPARYLVNPGRFLSSGRVGQVIILVPILAALVVAFRLILGIRTYGIFSPTIVAITLLDQGIVTGVLLYLFLLAAGIGVKMLVLNRLRLPRIAEFALVMAVLVALLSAVAAVPAGLVSVGAAFFPLIITTHLIEQASRSIEEHSLSEAMLLLGTTLLAALLLAGAGILLIGRSATVLWIAFAVSIVVTMIAGNYLGLRFTEFIRFKFLRRTHVH